MKVLLVVATPMECAHVREVMHLQQVADTLWKGKWHQWEVDLLVTGVIGGSLGFALGRYKRAGS